MISLKERLNAFLTAKLTTEGQEDDKTAKDALRASESSCRAIVDNLLQEKKIEEAGINRAAIEQMFDTDDPISAKFILYAIADTISSRVHTNRHLIKKDKAKVLVSLADDILKLARVYSKKLAVFSK